MDDSNPVFFEVTTQPLPTPWLNQDVGPTGLQGTATFANDTFTLKGAGAGIYSTSDAFHFVYQTLAGDGSITARVTNIPAGTTPQVGVMIRGGLSADSVDAFIYFNPNTAVMYYRTSTGVSSSYQTASMANPASPYWVRMARSGSIFTSYVSPDEFNWIQVGASQSINMAQSIFIG